MLATATARTCGSCTFCCKVMAVDELHKPVGKWCDHRVASGCSIYGQHPPSCQEFTCQWLGEPSMPAAFRPDRTKVVLTADDEGPRLIANCDPNNPMTWKREPIYSLLKRQAAITWRSNMTVMAKAGSRMWLITPTKEIDIGEVHDRAPMSIEKSGAGDAVVKVLPLIEEGLDVDDHLDKLRFSAAPHTS